MAAGRRSPWASTTHPEVGSSAAGGSDAESIPALKRIHRHPTHGTGYTQSTLLRLVVSRSLPDPWPLPHNTGYDIACQRTIPSQHQEPPCHEDRHEPAALDHARHRRALPAPRQAEDRPASTASRSRSSRATRPTTRRSRRSWTTTGSAARPSRSSTPEANPISPDAGDPQGRGRAAQVGHRDDRASWAARRCAGRTTRRWPSSPAPARPRTRRSGPPTCCARPPRSPSRHKVKLAIEYLNRFECYFLTTAAEAKALVQARQPPELPHDVRHLPRQHRGEGRRARRSSDLADVLRPRPHQRERPRHAGHRQVHWDETFKALKRGRSTTAGW